MANTAEYRADQMIEKMKRISSWIWNVYVKNQPPGPGNPNRPEISLSEKGGVDFDRMFDGLPAIRYRGYITVHSVSAPMGTPPEVARKAHDSLKPVREVLISPERVRNLEWRTAFSSRSSMRSRGLLGASLSGRFRR
jgi:hypothetical protein